MARLQERASSKASEIPRRERSGKWAAQLRHVLENRATSQVCPSAHQLGPSQRCMCRLRLESVQKAREARSADGPLPDRTYAAPSATGMQAESASKSETVAMHLAAGTSGRVCREAVVSCGPFVLATTRSILRCRDRAFVLARSWAWLAPSSFSWTSAAPPGLLIGLALWVPCPSRRRHLSTCRPQASARVWS